MPSLFWNFLFKSQAWLGFSFQLCWCTTSFVRPRIRGMVLFIFSTIFITAYHFLLLFTLSIQHEFVFPHTFVPSIRAFLVHFHSPFIHFSSSTNYVRLSSMIFVVCPHLCFALLGIYHVLRAGKKFNFAGVSPPFHHTLPSTPFFFLFSSVLLYFFPYSYIRLLSPLTHFRTYCKVWLYSFSQFSVRVGACSSTPHLQLFY